jgi:hypothetical protein
MILVDLEQLKYVTAQLNCNRFCSSDLRCVPGKVVLRRLSTGQVFAISFFPFYFLFSIFLF